MRVALKKLMTLVCVGVLTLSLVACGAADNTGDDRDVVSNQVSSTVNDDSMGKEEEETTPLPSAEHTTVPTTDPTSEPTPEPTEIPVEIEYPDSPIPIYKEVLEPYCDVEKGEVALRDVVTGSVIKFTFDTERFGVAVFDTDMVYMYDKTDLDKWFEVRTVIDDVYPEIHSCEAYFNRHFSPADKELTVEDFVLNNGMSVKLYNRSWSYRGGGSYTTFLTSGNNQGYYSVLPDGSTIMTSSIARESSTHEAIESGKNFVNDLFLTFELYTNGGYTEESGDFAPAGWTVPQDDVLSQIDENGKKQFYYYKDIYSNTIIVGVVMNDCVIPETIDGLPVTQCLTMNFTSSSKIVYPDSMCEMVRIGDRNSSIKYTVNGWCDGAVILPNLKRVESGATINTEGDVVLPDSIEYISGKVITDKTTGIVMPKNLKSLASQYEYVYNGPVRPLKYVHFQESENSLVIETSAFKGYKRLEEVILSDNIITIGDYAFSDCERLMEIELPSNLLRIGDGAFAGTGLSGTYVIPDGVVCMGDDVFPKTVDTIVVPDSVLSLGKVAKDKTVITTAGSVAETVITENGGKVVIISEKEMATYQAPYQAGKLGFVPKSTSVPEVIGTPAPTAAPSVAPAPAPEPTPEPEENQPVKIVEASYVQDIEAKYSWLGGANGVIITREMIGWGTDYHGAIDYYGNELVPRQHMYHFNTVNGNGWFAMQDYGGDALVMNAEGDIVYRVSNPHMVWLGEEKIIYGFWTDGKQDTPACDLACYDIATGTVEVWQENYAVDKNPYFTVATCGGYGAVTWHNFNRAGIMSPGYCKNIAGNDKLYEYYQTLEGANVSEAYSIDMDEFYTLKGIPADAIWTYGNTYYDGQYRMNIGKQIVIPVGQNQDYTYYLVDFEKAQVREAEYVNGVGQTCKEYLVTNIADIIVAEYDYIELSPTGVYLAATDDDYFYIDTTGNKIADYDDCSSFNTNGYALVLENGLAYVINTDFEKVSDGYPAERVYVALDALVFEYGDKVTYLFPLNQEEATEFEQKEQELNAAESFVPGMKQGIYMQVDPRYDYGNFYAELETDVLLLHCGLEVYTFASGHMTETNGEYVFENADGKLQITRTMSNYMFIYDRNTPNNKDDDLRYEMMLAEEVFDFIPLAGYESLDGQGEWGAIPVADEIKALLLEGMTDDYMITYRPQYSLYGYTYDEYEAVCFDGNGGQSSSVYLYVYDSEETASRKFTETKWDEPEQWSLHGNMIRYDKRKASNDFTLKAKWSRTDTFVYGEHCYYNERWNTYYYYSKIMSEEELKERNYISEFIATYAGDYYEGGAYNGRYIRVDGSAYEPNYFVVMLDPDVYYSNFHDVTVTELNHLLVLGHDEQQKISYVLDIVINGYDLMAAIMEYSYDPELSFENYIQKTKTKEYFFNGSIPSGVRGFPMF